MFKFSIVKIDRTMCVCVCVCVFLYKSLIHLYIFNQNRIINQMVAIVEFEQQRVGSNNRPKKEHV